LNGLAIAELRYIIPESLRIPHGLAYSKYIDIGVDSLRDAQKTPKINKINDEQYRIYTTDESSILTYEPSAKSCFKLSISSEEEP